jgi:hypothetical protein
MKTLKNAREARALAFQNPPNVIGAIKLLWKSNEKHLDLKGAKDLVEAWMQKPLNPPHGQRPNDQPRRA